MFHLLFGSRKKGLVNVQLRCRKKKMLRKYFSMGLKFGVVTPLKSSWEEFENVSNIYSIRVTNAIYA